MKKIANGQFKGPDESARNGVPVIPVIAIPIHSISAPMAPPRIYRQWALGKLSVINKNGVPEIRQIKNTGRKKQYQIL
jgi:hypothetical protein